MKVQPYSFMLLTNTLCHGAKQIGVNNKGFPLMEAELRESSIRGHLRRWHRILWGPDDTILCWGTAGGKGVKASASKVTLRLSRPKDEKKPTLTSYLPHKNYGGTDVYALPASTSIYVLNVSFRYLGKQESVIIPHVEKTIRCWLLLGTVGQRSTRAFGSVWPQDNPPSTPDALEKELQGILGTKYAFCLSPRPIDRSVPDMKLCTDTLSGKENEKFFGYVDHSKRMTSPLKMKFVKLGNDFYLLLHAEKQSTIDGAIRVLQDANKPIGKLFA